LSSAIARYAVPVATVCAAASSMIVGSSSPGRSSPLAIWSRREAAMTSSGPRRAVEATGVGMIPAIVVAARLSASSTQAAYTFSVVAPPLPWPEGPGVVVDRQDGRVLIVRATKKLLDRIGPPTLRDET